MKIPVIGGNGNVGKGIVEAFKSYGNDILVIDPSINKSFEEYSSLELEEILKDVKHIVYTADIGNRDEYEKDPNLSYFNNDRFSKFCEVIKSFKNSITIWYIGGSWTKRSYGNDFIVKDDSQNKLESECNAYELAKIESEENAKEISKKMNLKIRFIDYISIVPNLAPNFTIPKFVQSAFNNQIIEFSPGSYGRPLLSSVDAGKILYKLIDMDDGENLFNVKLIPGIFITFNEFADITKHTLEKELGIKIELKELSTPTPDFLKVRTESSILNFMDNTELHRAVLNALKQNVLVCLSTLKK